MPKLDEIATKSTTAPPPGIKARLESLTVSAYSATGTDVSALIVHAAGAANELRLSIEQIARLLPPTDPAQATLSTIAVELA